jgi:hypothetical protein
MCNIGRLGLFIEQIIANAEQIGSGLQRLQAFPRPANAGARQAGRTGFVPLSDDGVADQNRGE